MEQTAVASGLKEGRNLLTGTVVLGHGLKHIYLAAFSIVLPEIKAGLSLSNAAVGALVTAQDAAGGVATLPAGFLADRFGNRWSIILVVSLVIVDLGFFFSGTFPHYWPIVAALVLAFIGASLWP